MKTRLTSAVILLCLLATDLNTAASSDLGEISLEDFLGVRCDTISAASRRPQHIWEAPDSVRAVTRMAILSSGHRTICDAFAATPGADTMDDRYYSVRGFRRSGDCISRALLLIEGCRANDLVHDSALIPHPGLRSAKSATNEAVFEQSVGRAVKLTASGSRCCVRGLIACDCYPGVHRYQNMVDVRVTVDEVGAEGRCQNGWFTCTSHTVHHAEDGASGELTDSPRHLEEFRKRVPLPALGTGQGIDTLRTRDVVPGVAIFASVDNALDRRVGNTGFEAHQHRILHRPGRSFRVRAMWSC